jgi:hypothetical protein
MSVRRLTEEELARPERRRTGDRRRRQHEADLTQVPPDEDGEGVSDRCPHRPPLDDRVHDRLDPVVQNHQVGCCPSRWGPVPAERDASVGEPDGRRVVSAVARHGDGPPDPLVGAHDPHLVGRGDPGEDGHTGQRGVERRIVPGVERCPGHDRCPVGDAELLGYGRRGRRVIPGDHHDRDPCGTQARDRGGGRRAHPVGQREEYEQRAPRRRGVGVTAEQPTAGERLANPSGAFDGARPSAPFGAEPSGRRPAPQHDISELLERFDTNGQGLTSAEARRRLGTAGPNAIAEEGASWLSWPTISGTRSPG